MLRFMLVLTLSSALFGGEPAPLRKGIYHNTIKDMPARGAFRVEDIGKKPLGYSQKKFDKLESAGYFLVPNAPPCDPKTEYTIRGRHLSHAYYYCVDRKAFAANLSEEPVEDEKVPYVEILDHLHAAIAAPGEKEAATKIHLLRESYFAEWHKSGFPPPPGRYFFPSFFFEVRGWYTAKYKANGEWESHNVIGKSEVGEVVANQHYFLRPNLSPCDADREYTISKRGESSYACMDKELFARVMRNCSMPNPNGREPAFVDKLIEGLDLIYCDETSRAVVKREAGGSNRKSSKDFEGRSKEILSKVNPNHHLKHERENRSQIEVYTYDTKEVPNGYLVHYHGLLYGTCGERCKQQGYTVILDSKGKVLRFLDSTLAQSMFEYDIPNEGLERVVNLANNRGGSLQELFRNSSYLDESFSARMSKQTGIWGAGNSVGMFQLHMSLVRESLKLTIWPLYWKDKK